MRTISQREIVAFQKKILRWFSQNKRDLPWRHTRDPYRILVSEIMLQQTQVSRVIPKYESWLEKFPTLEALAKAKTSDVLSVWSGLGYNRRALYLLRLAQTVTSSPLSPRSPLLLLSPLPASVEALRKLPGIGEYTALAVVCFAFDQQIAMVDTNIRKVIAIAFFNGTPPDTKTTQQIADQLLPKGKAYEWNQALMDYSAAVLSKEKIPIPKQSKFSGSTRYYRGQIIKLLLKHNTLSVKELEKTLGVSDLTTIIEGLMKDNLVIQSKDTLHLP